MLITKNTPQHTLSVLLLTYEIVPKHPALYFNLNMTRSFSRLKAVSCSTHRSSSTNSNEKVTNRGLKGGHTFGDVQSHTFKHTSGALTSDVSCQIKEN